MKKVAAFFILASISALVVFWKKYSIFKYPTTVLTIFFLLICAESTFAQTIFQENMGTPSGTTTIVANSFQNSSSLSYANGGQSNSADIRNTSVSWGYSGASGGGNVFFSSTSGAYGFSIEGINASNYTSLSLQYGYRKEGATVHATFSVDYWNGSAWATLANSSSALFNEAAGATAGWYLAKSLSLPTDAQISGLKIRFVKTGTTSIRIDDVKLVGTEIPPTVSTTTVSSVTSNSVTFGGNVSATGGSSITGTGTVYAATATNANPTVGGAGVTNLSTSSPNSGTGSFTNTSGSVLSPNVQYSYVAYATKSTGLNGYGSVASFYTLAVTPSAPIVNSPSGTSLHVAIGSDSNSSGTTYAIYETTTSTYVQANGSLGATAVYQTAASWGTKTVTGLAATTTYTFQVLAKNGAGVPTSAGSSASGTTLVVPALTTTGTLSALSTTYGTASSYTTFTVGGTNLTDNIVITAPTGFEVSKTAGGATGYAATQTLLPSSGTVSTTTIYVRLSGAAYGTYSGNISVVSSNDVLTVTVPTVTSTVAQLGLTISGITALNKICDGYTNSYISGTATLNGVLTSDIANVTLVTNAATANFSDALVGTGKAVTMTGYTIIGSASGNYSLTQPTGLSADITPNTGSDVVLNSGSTTSNNDTINYQLFQGSQLSNSTSGPNGCTGVMGFYVRDGGAGADADTLPTELTAITFNVTNPDNILSARLFSTNTPLGQVVSVNSNSQLVFTGLSNEIVAPDNDKVAINLRVTFKPTVIDNQQMKFIIASVTAKAGGSLFTFANGGGATSKVTGDINRVKVTADHLVFDQQPTSGLFVGTTMSPSPTVVAKDSFGSVDLDVFSSVALTSSGTLSSSPQNSSSFNNNNGVYTFNNVTPTSSGTGFVFTVSATGLTSATSTAFSVNDLVVPTFTQVTTICAGGSLAALPTTSTNGVSGTWTPALNRFATTTYTFTPGGGQNATSTTMTIVVNPNLVPTFSAVGPIVSGASLAALPTTSNNIPTGITGTWAPTLNTTATTTYTFTPTAGQCAVPSTLTITVTSGGGSTANTTTLTENYIKTTSYRGINGTNPVTSITYFDGLGRPMQKIAGKQSNSGKDIVTHIEYDAFGRQEKEYLPYASDQSNISYIDGATLPAAIMAQYQVKYGDFNPYSQKLFEASPLNRVLKQAAPGDAWALGTGHEVKFDYQTNVSNEVKLYGATATISTNSISLDNGGGTVFYDPNELYKTITTDENNTPTEEFKDKEGHVVLKRVYATSEVAGSSVSGWHETYYVYDQFGNLTFVIPPLVTNASSQLDDLCYQYKYDYRNRLIEKKLPGKQWEFMVYDILDRVVATGPALYPFTDTPASVGWLLTKYDAFNRVVYTGWENGAVNSSSRISKQNDQNGLTSCSETKLSSSGTIDGIAVNYSNSVLPTSFKLLTVNYYDDYDYPNPPTIPTTVEGDPVFYNTTVKPKGLATGTWVRVLKAVSSTDGDRSYSLYDSRGRVIRQHTDTYLGGFTQVDSKLDEMLGRPNYTITTHQFNTTTNATILTVKDNYVYDAQDRLAVHTNQINGGTTNLLVKNDYDELGQLVAKKVGGTDVANYNSLQKVDYKYNIRGWMTGINIDTTTNAITLNPSEKDLFGFKINYNTVENLGNYAGTALFNGNISETQWETTTDLQVKKYGYFYDELNRLKNAVYQEPGSAGAGGQVPEYYNESVKYDKNGNIVRLTRNGGENTSLPANQIDDLSYSYGSSPSNQLQSVSDGYLGNADGGFIDGATAATEYTYDANGNMITDLNKGIATIGYNHLNLPIKITFVAGGTIEYLYDAQGKKLEKKVTQGSNITTTSYLDGFQYVNSELQFFPQAEGYVKKTGANYSYVYNYTDHLGNVMLSYIDADQSGTITPNEVLEESSYYPFGMKQAPNNGNNFQPGYKYKYNGKEYQDELGLNLYDYGAMLYDPALGRRNNIDPLAEQSRRWSPYSYCYNNPVRFTDPDGMSPDGDFINEKGNLLGNDGINDGKVYVVKTTEKSFDSGAPSAGISKSDKNATEGFIKANSGNTEAFQSNDIAYKNSVEIEGSADTRQSMVDVVNQDNGNGGTKPENNREYGGRIKSDGTVVQSPAGDVANPLVDAEASINISHYDSQSTFHSHPSGTNSTGTGGGSGMGSSTTLGGSTTTGSFNHAPSNIGGDVQNSGSKVNYVFSRGNGTVYIYNNTGVIATVPQKNFVTPKK